MKFEVLRKNHLKRNIIIGVIAVLIISAIVLNFTRARYRITESIPLVNGTINYTPYDFKMIAMYQESNNGEYVSIDSVPTSGYTLNTTESYCEINGEKDSSIPMSYEDGRVYIGVNTKGTKCYLYFDEYEMTAKDTILANKRISTRSNFSTTLTTDTTGTIYSAIDDDGTTYYFAGAPTDNWVSFAGYYWRIIRINGDGTIRIIYNGTSTATTGNGTQLSSTSAFNSSYNNNAYVGFKYTSGSVHGTGANSTILDLLNSWYSNNLPSYESYIDTNAGYCGDRQPSTDNIVNNGLGGTGTTLTYYGAWHRLYGAGTVSNALPTFECNNNDLYTVSESSKGNHALAYPIGLITADEVVYSGGFVNNVNKNYYLYTGYSYWTMTPAYFMDGFAGVFAIDTDRSLVSSDVIGARGIRPVINLRSDVTISSGDGTSSNPYVIAT